ARLFTAPQLVGELLLVLPEPTDQLTIPLDQAWSSDELLGSFVYSAAGLGITAADANLFVDAVHGLLAKADLKRAFIWTGPWAGGSLERASVLGLADDAMTTLTKLTVVIAAGLEFVLAAPAALNLNPATGIVAVTGRPLGYEGTHAPQGAPVTSATLTL